MSSSDERIKKAVAASNAPSQVVRRPVPALGIFMAAAHQSALNPGNVAATKLPVPNTSPVPVRATENQQKAMDAKFGPSIGPTIATKSVVRLTPDKTARVTLRATPDEYSGDLERRHNEEITNEKPAFNPWSSEAYSIFEGNHTLQSISLSCFFLCNNSFLFISKMFINIFSRCNCSILLIQLKP
jgi:hypothetical protein